MYSCHPSQLGYMQLRELKRDDTRCEALPRPLPASYNRQTHNYKMAKVVEFQDNLLKHILYSLQ